MNAKDFYFLFNLLMSRMSQDYKVWSFGAPHLSFIGYKLRYKHNPTVPLLIDLLLSGIFAMAGLYISHFSTCTLKVPYIKKTKSKKSRHKHGKKETKSNINIRI